MIPFKINGMAINTNFREWDKGTLGFIMTRRGIVPSKVENDWETKNRIRNCKIGKNKC